VLIADMYGDAKTADNPKDAGALAGSVMKNPKVMESRFNAARETLAKQPSVDSGAHRRRRLLLRRRGGAEHGARRSGPRSGRRFPCIARAQHAGARARAVKAKVWC